MRDCTTQNPTRCARSSFTCQPPIATGVPRIAWGDVAAPARKPLSPSSTASYIRALKVLTAWLTEEGDLEGSPSQHVRTPKAPKRQQVPLTNEEIRAFLEACKLKRVSGSGANSSVQFARPHSLNTTRDTVLILMLLNKGPRASENHWMLRDEPSRTKCPTVISKDNKMQTVQESQRTRRPIQ